MKQLPAYVQIVGMWAQTTYTYRFNLLFEVVTLLLQIFLLKVVWTAVYAGRTSVADVELPALISYLTLANLQFWIMPTFLASYIQERVQEGRVALDLARPVGFIGQMVAHEIGGIAGIFPFLVLSFPFALIVGGLQPPSSAIAILLYVVSLVLAFLIATLLSMLLGMIAFWTLDASGFQVIYYFVSKLFAGTLVPLWFFPPVLRALGDVLPFQEIAFVPVAIYQGKLAGSDLLRALALQALWVLALYLLARLVWRRALRRVVIQGG